MADDRKPIFWEGYCLCGKYLMYLTLALQREGEPFRLMNGATPHTVRCLACGRKQDIIFRHLVVNSKRWECDLCNNQVFAEEPITAHARPEELATFQVGENGKLRRHLCGVADPVTGERPMVEVQVNYREV